MWKQFLEDSRQTLGFSAVRGSNAYLYPYSDALYQVPVHSSGHFILDESVPFLQIVIHGLLPYTSIPGNFFHDPVREKLTWIEYGCSPYFVLSYADSNLLKYTEFNHLFSSKHSDWMDTIVDTYLEMKTALKDSWNQQIMRHRILDEELRYVEYANDTAIIINYGDREKEYQGISIPPLDYRVLPKALDLTATDDGESHEEK